MDYARQFCPPNKAAKAVGRIKRAVQTGWEIPLEAGLALERENQQLLFESEDAKEGLGGLPREASGEVQGEVMSCHPERRVILSARRRTASSLSS